MKDEVKLTGDDVDELLRIVDDPQTRELHLAYGDFVLIVRKPACEQSGEVRQDVNEDNDRSDTRTASGENAGAHVPPSSSGTARRATGGA